MTTLHFPNAAPKPSDRRAHARVDARYEVAFDYYASDGKKMGHGYATTINVSVGGLLLETNTALMDGQLLALEIISPLYAFMATGEIVYAVPISEEIYRLGVHFKDTIQGGWEQLLTAPAAQESV